MSNTFNEVDIDGDNRLSKEEIISIFKKQGIEVNEEIVNKIIRDCDTDGDGTISIEEYNTKFSNIESISELIDAWKAASGIDYGSEYSFSVSVDIIPFIAGACGGVCSRTATSPLERVKLMAQCGTLPKNSTPLQAVRNLLSNEGVSGLFKGNFYNCLRVIPFSGIICVTYGKIVKQLPDEGLGWHGRLGAGCAAGGLATICTHPLDTLRMRASAICTGDSGKLPPLSVGVLYRGLAPTLFAMSLFVGFQQYVFDYCRSYAKQRFSPEHGRSPPSHFIASGVIAGVVSQTLVYPLDLLRRRVQLGITANKSVISHYTWLSKEGGLRSLYAGLIPTYAKVIPAVAVSVTVRDAVLGRIDWI